MAEPKPTGAYTDDQGTLRCRATGNRCLGRRQATELAGKARQRGTQAEVVHCGACSSWHYHKAGRLQGRPPRPPRRVVRSWRR